MSSVVSFAEESVWDGERFRSIRREIVFVVQLNNVPIEGQKSSRHEFRADFGIFWDVEDDWLIQILREEIPGPEWGWYVYHKKLDQSGISVINPDSGRTVGTIYPRGRTKQKLSGEIAGANIVPIAMGKEYRAARLQREADRAKRRRERGGPEGC